MADTQVSKANSSPTAQGVQSMQLQNHSNKESSKVVIDKKVNVKYKKHNLIRKSSDKSTAQDRENKEDVDEREISFLPMDIIRIIFLLLPADFIYNVLRFVCRSWHELINDPVFIRDHFSTSTIGVLMQNCVPCNPQHQTVAELVEIRNEEKPINSHLHQERKRKRKIKPLVREGERILTEQELGDKLIFQCCDGLILLMDSTLLRERKTFHIANPIRKECMIVTPPLDPLKTRSYNVAIARATAGSEYKVVVSYRSLPCQTTPKFTILVSTIGSADNSWREVGSEPCGPRELQMLACGKYVYWICYWYRAMLAMALDVETETLHQVVNRPPLVRYDTECIIESESFMVLAGMRDDFGWDFWGLTEPAKDGGEWTKLFDLYFLNKLSEVGVKEERGKSAMPVIVVLQANVVVFSINYCRNFIGYNFKTGHIFKFGKRTSGHLVSVFVPSLVPVSGSSPRLTAAPPPGDL